MSALTAGAPSHVLVKALEDAGWGPLAGADFRGVQSVLAALTRALDPRSAAGKATVWQISERANYSEGWTRRCLQILEELELITWERGGVVDGKPVPSWFRVSKKALLDLVRSARRHATERLSGQAAAVRGRITGYRLHRTKRRGQTRRSDHPSLVKDLLSIEEVPRAAEPPLETVQASPEAISDAVAGIRARLREQRALRAAHGRDSKTATTREGAT